MRYPPNFLSLMIEQDAFRACRLMRQQEFVRFCQDRNVNVDDSRLRQFERIGIFRPMLRVYKPDVTLKIEDTPKGKRYAGTLEDGEIWDGETRVEMAEFDPSATYAANWMEYGSAWVPGQGEWSHESSIDEQPERHEAYYSRFQVYPLAHVVTAMTLRVQLEWAVLPDGSTKPDWGETLGERAAELAMSTAETFRNIRQDDIKAALAQLLANRYYFKTQSDGRRITISQFHDWDWYEFVRNWQITPIIEAFEITQASSKDTYERTDLDWSHLDPMSKWYSLARFVSVEKRKRLKGDALHALTVREMAEMFRLFHADAYGETLRPIGEVGVQIIKRIPDVDPEADPMRALELVANYYGVNAKPQLVLFVEGETEQTVLPQMFERIYGAPASRYGIEILSLGGVDNAAGGKEAPFSALWRLVDYLHHHQTVAFVLLDNEGFASRNVRQGLPKAHSVHSKNRKATRPDHIKVWRTTFEFDNFSNTEIASALNKLAGSNQFGRADVADCRKAVSEGPKKNQHLYTIDRLFADRMGYSLGKPELGKILTDIMFAPTTRKKPENRPIVRFLERVANKASLNHQPTTQEAWESNQSSGYLGTLLPSGRAQKRRRSAGRKGDTR